MKKLSLILSVLFTIEFVCSNYAVQADELLLGKADLYSILLLHPAMKDFDVKRNAFAECF